MLPFPMLLKLCTIFSSASVRPTLLLLALLEGGDRRRFPSSFIALLEGGDRRRFPSSFVTLLEGGDRRRFPSSFITLLEGGDRRRFPTSFVTGFTLLPGTGLGEATFLAGNEEERDGAGAATEARRDFCTGLGESTVLVTNGFVLGCAGLFVVAGEAGFLTCCFETSVAAAVGLLCFFGAAETFVLVILLTAPLSFAVPVCGEDDAAFSLPGNKSLLLVAIIWSTTF